VNAATPPPEPADPPRAADASEASGDREEVAPQPTPDDGEDEHLADDPTLGRVMKPLVDIENKLGQGAIAGLVFLLGFFIFVLCAPPISG
jgi:hypothetical protein